MIRRKDLVQIKDTSMWSDHWKERITEKQTILRVKKFDGEYVELIPLVDTDWKHIYVASENLRKI